MGYVLSRSRVCFVSGFRDPLATGSSAMARALLGGLMLATLLYWPLQYRDYRLGVTLTGNIYPIGLNTLTGGLLFGLGMVLAGGCITGILTRIGDGMVTQLASLAGAVAGATVAAYHWPWWDRYAHWIGAVHLSSVGGWMMGPLLQLTVLALLTRYLTLRQTAQYARQRRGRAGQVHRRDVSTHPTDRLFKPAWPPLAGTLLLALLSAAYVLATGRSWGASSAFALWGAELWARVGGRPGAWPYFVTHYPESPPVWLDLRSISNFGLILGSVLAALSAATFRLRWPRSLRQTAVALVGGLLMGYGARLTPGCNIGAFFIAIPSMSVHGWVWAVMTVVGAWMGVRVLVVTMGLSAK
jgi:uncharacterized membrane protein YedE/YeeE